MKVTMTNSWFRTLAVLCAALLVGTTGCVAAVGPGVSDEEVLDVEESLKPIDGDDGDDGVDEETGVDEPEEVDEEDPEGNPQDPPPLPWYVAPQKESNPNPNPQPHNTMQSAPSGGHDS